MAVTACGHFHASFIHQSGRMTGVRPMHWETVIADFINMALSTAAHCHKFSSARRSPSQRSYQVGTHLEKL